MPQKLNMQRPSSSSLPHHYLQLLILLILSSSCYIDIAFAFTSSPTIIAPRQTNKVTSSSTNNVIHPRIHHSTTLHYSSNSNDDNNNNSSKAQQQRVQVAGVSVSPIGFLVILQSIMNDANNQKMEVAFPIQLTSSGNNNNNINNDGANSSSNNNLTIPSLFQENIDQSSVTTPEALTFLQLLNGVDMATPILPPDTLSSVCVWYAFLLEEKLLEERMGVDVEEGMGEGGLLYEDELGLETLPLQSSSQPKDESNEQEKAHHEKYSSALNYIRAMVRTTLPPSKDGSYFINYIDASNWQRARVQLPRVWLHGVKMEMMDLALFHHNKEEEDGGTAVGRVPIKYTLQCSVDDGLKRLEIPLFAIPSSYQLTSSSSSSSSTQLEQQLEISNEILQELSHNYNTETSASFLSLALYHRYNTSGSGEAGSAATDSPTLKVDEELLNQLLKMQQTKKSIQYCWPTSIRSIIQANGLPMYRPLHQIKEEDQRVLERIYGEGGGNDGGGGGMEEEDSSNIMSDKSKKEPKKKALTLEQQALQQRLKSAWKIATQKGDSGALEKIQKAMEDLEKELIIEEEEVEEDTSTLDRIQRAMRERDEIRDDEEEEEVVGLVSDLEEAIRMEDRSEVDDREEEL